MHEKYAFEKKRVSNSSNLIDFLNITYPRIWYIMLAFFYSFNMVFGPSDISDRSLLCFHILIEVKFSFFFLEYV